MLVTEHFQVLRRAGDDWFDAILDVDTKLFVDPFMVFQEDTGFWAGAHDAIIGHFDRAFALIAEGNLNPESIAYRKAVDILTFREPRELCLGYSAAGTQGAGSGTGYAALMAGAIADAIRRGLQHPRHFEELGVMNEGIGADRISDITSTVLKPRLIAYTQQVGALHRLAPSLHMIFAAGFDQQRQRWQSREVPVLTNPVTGGPLLLVPQRFLRKLPVLNPDDWWNDYENRKLREDVNYEVLGKVNKAKIIAIARAEPHAVRHWTLEKERQTAPSYDLLKDPSGLYQWHQAAATFVSAHPLTLTPPTDDASFRAVIAVVLEQYRLFVEDQGGWRLLWNDSTLHAGRKDKAEEAAQLLFMGIARNYCKANNVSIDREVDLGRGPVDFKFSNGYRNRAHLEIKKLHNGKFWNGLHDQLPAYMKGDEVKVGWFVALRYRSSKAEDERQKQLPNRVKAVAESKNLELYHFFIDARPQQSASKLSDGSSGTT
jgi:hypothetical protein